MAARNRLNKVYSIYHLMDEKGVFETNPANAQAVSNDGLSIYAGPVQYPKMLYHPKGEMEIQVQGIMVVDRDGNPALNKDGSIRYSGQVWGVKNRIVENEEQETEWVALGWLTSEAQARRINPELAPKAPPKTKIELQAEENEMLKRRLAELESVSSVVTRAAIPAKEVHK